MTRKAPGVLLPVLLAAAAACVLPAAAQDFAPAQPAGPQRGACALLDRALPARDAAATLEAGITRWLGEPSLESRAVAVLAAPGAARIALGVSQTGDPELGWTSAALALGAATREGGTALRVVTRHDQAAGAVRAGHLDRGGGIEAGLGAWLAPLPALCAWAAAPQIWTRGAAPPLARALELGLRAEAGELAAWVALAAPRGGDDGQRALGVELAFARASVWAEARDAPLRAGLGLAARVGSLAIEARVDAHPQLGETTRLVVAWRGSPAGVKP